MRSSLLLIVALVTGCHLAIESDRHVGDAGVDVGLDAGTDAGRPDAGPADAGSMDAGPFDAGSVVLPPDGGAPSAANRAFVLSTPMGTASFGGLDGADRLCNEAAGRGSLPDVGSYVAWLSTESVDAVDRLAGSSGWVRPDGRPVFHRPVDAVQGGIFYPPLLNERGAVLYAPIWTGTLPSGTAEPGGTCEGWTASSGTTTLGVTHGGTARWTSTYASGCGGNATLLCLGTGRNVNVVPRAPTDVSRFAFLSEGAVRGNEGRDAMDALCQSEARAAALTGDFIAFVSTTSEPAVSRLAAGEPWVRPDGVIVADSPSTLRTGRITAAISITLAGRRYADRVWTGSARPDEVPTASCADWSTTAGSGRFGNSGDSIFFDGGSFTCTSGLRVYCFER